MRRLAPLAVLLLAGCSFAPHYLRPAGAVPDALPHGGLYPVAATDAPDVTAVGWRAFFTDPRLTSVIEAGLENNRDLRVAAANVLEARARFSAQRAALVPATGVSAAATYTNNPLSAAGASTGTGTGTSTGTGTTATGGIGGTAAGTGAAAVGGGTGVGTGAGVGTASSAYQYYSLTAGFSAFELDLFGRVRNLTRAAQEQYFASEEARRTTRISLIAEIATAWLQLAADQDQLALSRRTLDAFGQTRDLTAAQFRIGVASELAFRQADTNYQAALNDIAVAETRIAQDRNALDLLVGRPTADAELPSGLGEGQATLSDLPAGLSSAVLLRRPDVLGAEHQLIAAHANIGAARAARFPTISLTAAVGTVSGALGTLFAGGSFTYTGAPGVTVPLFDGGRIAANIRLAEAQRTAAVASYDRTVQIAFREVADALAQRGTIGRQIDAQRTAYAAQQQLVATRLARTDNLVELYRALGGGLL